MAPRNNDANPNYKKKNCPVENNEVEIKNILPDLLHKKHKVVKLVKSQIQKIQEGGLICDLSGPSDAEAYNPQGTNSPSNSRPQRRAGRPERSRDDGSPSSSMEGEVSLSEYDGNGFLCVCFTFLFILLALFLFVLLMVWISAGPLSNAIAQTPIPVNSFVRTDSLCVLEKKYLLRWSKPEYYE